MARILGIDPGSRITGYGIIDEGPKGAVFVASGCVRVQVGTFPENLKQIYDGILAIALQHAPDALAIEQVFVHKNADSALKLGQARGAAICAALAENLPVYEYTARQVKQALVGRGSAAKEQVRYMIKILLNLKGDIPLDASDALGVALCHAHHQQTRHRLEQTGYMRAGRT